MLRFLPRSLAGYAPVVLLCCIGALFLIFRSNLAGFDDSYVFADNVTQDWPAQEYFNSRLRQGELPLWNPYQSAGNPTIGTLQHRLIYPPRLVFTLLLGLDWGQFCELVFHFALGLLGTYFMLRSYSLKSGPAILGAIFFMLANDYLASFNVTQNLIATIVWLPACIATINLFLIWPTFMRAMAIAITHAMLVYAGHPQYGFFAAHACVIVFLSGLYLRRKRLRRQLTPLAAYSVLAGLSLLVVTAPQLFASFEFFSLGWRGEAGLSFQQFNPYGGRSALRILPEAIGGAYKPQFQIINLVIIAGIVTGYWRLRRFREKIIANILLGIPFLLLAMAAATPISEWFYYHYPLGSSFRYPQRASWVLLIPCAFLVGILTQVVIAFKRTAPGSILRFRVFLSIWVLIFLAIMAPQKRLRTQAFPHVSGMMHIFAKDIQETIPAQSSYRFESICAFFFLEPCQKAGMVARRLSLNDYEPANTYRTFLHAQLVSEKVGNGPGFDIWLGETNLTFISLTNQQALNILRASSVKWILGDSRLWKQTPPEDRAKMEQNGISKPIGVVVNHAAQLIMQKRFGSGFTTELLEGFGGQLPLYHVFKVEKDVAPRAYLTNRIRFSSGPTESFELLKKINPMVETVIESQATESYPEIPKREDHMQPVDFATDSPERVGFTTNSSGHTFLVFNDKFFPGWVATVDGQAVEIFPANLIFRAIKIPPGKHIVEFTYRPKTLIALLAIAALGYLTILTVFLVTVVRRLIPRP
ncbi:MAG: YfhO family protein [Leptospirales bacterium]|nr:YfhO family protein [Leptospirales bacterium]